MTLAFIRRGIAPIILNLSTTCHVPGRFNLEQRTQVPVEYGRLSGHHKRSALLDQKKMLCPQSGLESASLSVANSLYKLRIKAQCLAHSATCTNTGTIRIQFIYMFRIKLTTANSDYFITQHGTVRLQMDRLDSKL
jgi:hypothetical protein